MALLGISTSASPLGADWAARIRTRNNLAEAIPTTFFLGLILRFNYLGMELLNALRDFLNSVQRVINGAPIGIG